MKELDEREEDALMLLKEYALADDDKLTESALRLKHMLLAIAGKTTTKCKEEMEGLRAWAKLLQGIATERHVKECADFVYMTAEQALANCNRPYGNMAAIRTALENLRDEAKSNYDLHDYQIAGAPGERGVAHCVDAETIIDEVNSALSKPARNCDLLGGDKYKLHSLWWNWTGTKEGQNEDGTAKLTFGEWLLEEAEKECSKAIIPSIELVKSDNEHLRKAMNHIVYYVGERVANRMTDTDFTVAVKNEVDSAKGKISCQFPPYE